jgi:hypothetical protein
MRKSLIILIIVTTGLFSCGQGSQSTPNTITVEKETLESTENDKSQKLLTLHDEKYIDTQNEYPDSNGKRVIIQNSLPKGGLKYTDTNSKDFVYAIFWTHITNETANPLELKINFPADSFELPSSAEIYFKIFLPSEAMTPDKLPLFNYGLAGLEYLLDKGFHNASSLEKTIKPNGSYMFYVVTLFNQGVDGVVRAELSLKERNLFYRINDKVINCGQINLSKLNKKYTI